METIFKVVFPSALPGIIAATLLGVMRALGETMVVLMAAGGAAILPTMFTDPIRPLTSTIAAEMGETPVGSTHYHALFFAGLILLIMTLAINLASLYIEKRGIDIRIGTVHTLAGFSTSFRRLFSALSRSRSSAVIGAVAMYLLKKGAGTLSIEFLTQPPRDGMMAGGILTPLIGTMQLVIVSMGSPSRRYNNGALLRRVR